MKRDILFCAAFAACTWVSAQGTVSDYNRAYEVRKKFTRDKMTGAVEDARWSDGKTLTFSVRNAEGKLDKKAAFIDEDGNIVVGEPAREEGNDGNGHRGDWRRNDRQSGNRGGSQWNGRMERQQPTKTGPQFVEDHWMNVDEERAGRPVVSPDSTKVAFIRDYNVWVCDYNVSTSGNGGRMSGNGGRTSGNNARVSDYSVLMSDIGGKNAKQLSFDGTLSHYYSGYLSWSPDSRFVAVNKIRPAEKRYVYYVESSPKTQLQPILHQQEYAKPGDELLQKHPCVFEVATGKAIVPSNELFPMPYDIRGPQWNEDSKALTFEYNERGHKHFRVLEMDVETGDVRILVEEKSDKFVNYNRYFRHTLEGGKQMIWMSERDNWTHLYMVDLAPGAKSKNAKSATKKLQGGIRQITKGEWVVRRVLRVDEENKVIYFTASGVNKDEDPYLIHYYKIGFDGNNMVCLTPEDGNHSAQFNEDYTFIVDTYSKVDTPPVTVVRSVADPSKMVELGRADITALKETGFVTPEVFAAPGRDGKTMMWGVVYRPTNFDPSKSYPVIEYIYAGPGDAYTPKSFSPYNWNMTSLAELGFVVVQLDGMGTSYRGKEFEEVCYKNLKDAGFPDRIAWMKALKEKYPYLDLDNVGIFGASAGGQESTTAVLLHGDFYKAAYSSCGCHDNRMDKIWWNEQWMGYPVDSAYVECSNVENAHKLTGALMLVVGEMDDNVDPASTMQVADALIKANKDFELVVLPGVHHTMGEDFGEHKRFDFFVKNLLHKDAPKWNEIKR